MYLSHFVLPKSVQAAALSAALAENTYAEHQEFWRFFGDKAPNSERPFLYRLDRTDKGVEVYMLSEEQPEAPAPWVTRSREFNPAFKQGQRLAFSLRFSPTVDRARPNGRSVRTDLVMEAYRAAEGQTPVHALGGPAAQTWLGARATAAGFELNSVEFVSYGAPSVRKQGNREFKVPLLDVRGELTVTDPAAFLQRVCSGFGKSRYAGAGLMLVKPVC